MVQMVAGLNVGFSKGSGEIAGLEQTWLLPLSLCLSTIGAAMVSWQIATSRSKPSMNVEWFWGLLGRDYGFVSLWRFVLLGLSLGLGFFRRSLNMACSLQTIFRSHSSMRCWRPHILLKDWLDVNVCRSLSCGRRNALSRGFLFTGCISVLGAECGWSAHNSGLCRGAYAQSLRVLAGPW